MTSGQELTAEINAGTADRLRKLAADSVATLTNEDRWLMCDAARQLSEAAKAVAAERARCAAVCREVAMFYDAPDAQAVVAHACADEIERGPVTP